MDDSRAPQVFGVEFFNRSRIKAELIFLKTALFIYNGVVYQYGVLNVTCPPATYGTCLPILDSCYINRCLFFNLLKNKKKKLR